MTADLLHFLGGAATVLILSALASARRWYPRLKFTLSNAFTPRPAVNNFKKLIVEAKFQGLPEGGRNPFYFVRYGYKHDADEKPLYHFFGNPDIDIQQFIAFLIPPLDFGHGKEKQRVGLEFDGKWETYLTRMGAQAKKSAKIEFRNRKYLFFHDRIKFEARRFIFFDENLLAIFIFHSSWVIENAHLKGVMFEPAWESDPLCKFARSVLLYAFDIMRCHQIIWTYRSDIECRYLPKSRITASQYYDFGCYLVEGVPIIYNPIYMKNDSKSIVEERVLIGTTTRQLRRIEEYRRDFNKLWTATSAEHSRQVAWLEGFRHKYPLNEPGGQYYQLECLCPEFFHEGYFAQLAGILAPIIGNS